jgi:hypothetical protein
MSVYCLTQIDDNCLSINVLYGIFRIIDKPIYHQKIVLRFIDIAFHRAHPIIYKSICVYDLYRFIVLYLTS